MSIKAKIAAELAERVKGGDGLAMDFASRMQRAKEQGFDTDTTYYHGTNADIDEFNLDKFGSKTDAGMYGKGAYLSNNPDISNSYAKGDGGNVMASRLKLKNPFITDMKNPMPDVDMGDIDIMERADDLSDIYSERLTEKLKSMGHDGVISRGGLQAVVFDPSNIRSVNAAFDPAKKDSSNLLASMGAGTAAGAGLMASDDSEASFIGAAAKTWNKSAEALAKKMTDKGASRDEIWQATGQMGSPTFKDVDGRWKQEISDQGFKEKPLYSDTDENYTTSNDPDRWFSWRDEAAERGGLGIQKGYDLGDLAEAYPQLRGTKVLPNEENAFRGSYDNDRTITVASPDALMRLDEADYKRFEDEQLGRSIPLHELQHAIQEREGFARGGSPNDIESDLKALTELNTLSFSEMDDFQKQMFKELRAKYGNVKDPYEAYKRLAGEAESRNVEKRLDYDMDKRVSNPPWNTLDVPENELIVRGQRGRATVQGMIGGTGAGIGALGLMGASDDSEAGVGLADMYNSISMPTGSMSPPASDALFGLGELLARGERAVKGSPAEYLYPTGLKDWAQKAAYGEADWGDRVWAGLDIVP